MPKTLIIIPPFTQVNTPYPSASFLSGYLNSKGCVAESFDLSLEVFLRIFSRGGLTRLFSEIKNSCPPDEFVERALALEEDYINVIDAVINYLQGKNPNLAYRITGDNFLPQGESFTRQTNEDEAFGYFGLQDKAKYYASLMIDDLTEIIRKTITPHFGLSRYAEKIAVSPPLFDPLIEELSRPLNLVEKIIVEETEKIISSYKPDVLGYTIPFPGNLLGALVSSKYVKEKYPAVKIVFGGGYINTELRSLKDERFFNYTDFVTYDDGELPLYNIIKNLENKEGVKKWVRTLTFQDGKLEYLDNAPQKNLSHNELYPPSAEGIEPCKYVALTEMLNPMHRIWSDGYWNKLMAAHGCYWSKCTFCDVTLDYIGRYSPADAVTIVNWMEEMIKQTGRTSFHFVDEAAPPAVLKELSLEIIRRKLPVTWWGNIRFEKAFTKDLCRLMAASGCVAVSGGLEVADERLLKLINKGVTLQQAAIVCKNFRDAGIMAHSYLMYGFPSQTEQEIINSLELVRQFMKLELFQSAFWHLFTLTAHSPIAQDAEAYKIKIMSASDNPFANDNLIHYDLTGLDYEKYTAGLKKALYNYMHGTGLDWDARTWFDFLMPETTIEKNLVEGFLLKGASNKNELSSRAVWIGGRPLIKNMNAKQNRITVSTNSLKAGWIVSTKIAGWIEYLYQCSSVKAEKNAALLEIRNNFPGGESEFDSFARTDIWKELRETALLLI